jgi:hypothetical protein
MATLDFLKKKEAGDGDGDESTHPANVLLQILFPIVLVLLFMLVHRMRTLEKRSQELSTLMELVGNEDRGQTLSRLMEALLEIQKQRLIAALEMAKAERRDTMDINVFAFTSIKVVSGEMADERFKRSCRKTFEILGTPEAVAAERDLIYRIVLGHVGISDLGTDPMEGKIDILDRPGAISNANRLFIKKAISEFTAGLAAEASELQFLALRDVLDYYADNDELLDALDPGLSVRRKGYILCPDSAKTLYAAGLRDRIVHSLEDRVKSQGYEFFAGTWERLRGGNGNP